jgi:hypothetical protein
MPGCFDSPAGIGNPSAVCVTVLPGLGRDFRPLLRQGVCGHSVGEADHAAVIARISTKGAIALT